MERHEFKQFQDQLTDSVLTGNPKQALVEGLEDASGVPSDKRLQIHHNNFRETLADGLRGIFPALEAFVGVVFLKGALSEFCVKNPPRNAALFGYGSTFADFLDGHAASEQVPYASDVVRLEWAIHELQLVDEQALTSTVSNEWRVNPNTRIIRSDYPILSLWSVANGQLPPEAVHLDQGGQTVAVCLVNGEVTLLALSTEESEIAERLSTQLSADKSAEEVLTLLKEKNIIVPA